jgi:hypothetical protein
MFLLSSALPLSLDTALAFLAGGAAGIVMTRAAQWHRVGPTLSLVDAAEDAMPPSAQSPGEPMLWSDAAVLETPALFTRARAGRLPLPHCVTALTPSDEPALALVDVFVGRLATLPYQAWLDVGRAQPAGRARATTHATTFAILEATIATGGLGIAAWYARDAVETSVFLATGGASQWSASERRAIARAHGVAEGAALALLARDALAPKDFTALFAPFAHVLSSDELTRFAASRSTQR